MQITKLDFLPRGIVVELNGGGKSHRNWKDHLQLSVGVPVPMVTKHNSATTAALRWDPRKKPGATFYLDFNRPLPDMTPAQVKQYLSVIMDFSSSARPQLTGRIRSPLPMQEAIRDKRAIVGMDREEVQAAMGRPDRKVRERKHRRQRDRGLDLRPPSVAHHVRSLYGRQSQPDRPVPIACFRYACTLLATNHLPEFPARPIRHTNLTSVRTHRSIICAVEARIRP